MPNKNNQTNNLQFFILKEVDRFPKAWVLTGFSDDFITIEV